MITTQLKAVLIDERLNALARFRESWQETASGESLVDTQASVGLILSDICNALGFTLAERQLVLGDELMVEIDAWHDASVIPTAKVIELMTERPGGPVVQ